jgi:hypothetical protein
MLTNVEHKIKKSLGFLSHQRTQTCNVEKENQNINTKEFNPNAKL